VRWIGRPGYDAGKKVKRGKRHILVDTFGLVLAAVVHPATVQDREGARLVLGRLESEHGWISKVWADGGYAGRLSEWVSDLRRHRKIDLEIVKPKPALRKP
jgi:putative transposase